MNISMNIMKKILSHINLYRTEEESTGQVCSRGQLHRSRHSRNDGRGQIRGNLVRVLAAASAVFQQVHRQHDVERRDESTARRAARCSGRCRQLPGHAAEAQNVDVGRGPRAVPDAEGMYYFARCYARISCVR